jgi:hypothetical protein
VAITSLRFGLARKTATPCLLESAAYELVAGFPFNRGMTLRITHEVAVSSRSRGN